MSEFGDILNVYKSMNRTKTGTISEVQHNKGSAGKLTEDDKGDIIDLINATRKVNGQSELTDNDINEQRNYDENAPARITKQGVNAYANLIK